MYVVWVLLAYLVIYIARVIRGPSIWDRILGMSLISAKIILILVAYASYTDSTNPLDFAIVYALSGFIGTIFISVFLSERIIADKNKRGNKQ